MEEHFRQNVIDLAMIQNGKSYVWGATGPDEFDSSGLTYYLFHELFNLDIHKDGYGGENVARQMTNDIGLLRQYPEHDPKKIDYLKEIQAGDLLFFMNKLTKEEQSTKKAHYPGHVGVYLGNETFIHASPKEGKVILSKLDHEWLPLLVASRDIITAILK